MYMKVTSKILYRKICYLMPTTSELKGAEKYSLKRTRVNVGQSDIISVCRENRIRTLIKRSYLIIKIQILNFIFKMLYIELIMSLNQNKIIKNAITLLSIYNNYFTTYDF